MAERWMMRANRIDDWTKLTWSGQVSPPIDRQYYILAGTPLSAAGSNGASVTVARQGTSFKADAEWTANFSVEHAASMARYQLAFNESRCLSLGAVDGAAGRRGGDGANGRADGRNGLNGDDGTHAGQAVAPPSTATISLVPTGELTADEIVFVAASDSGPRETGGSGGLVVGANGANGGDGGRGGNGGNGGSGRDGRKGATSKSGEDGGDGGDGGNGGNGGDGSAGTNASAVEVSSEDMRLLHFVEVTAIGGAGGRGGAGGNPGVGGKGGRGGPGGDASTADANDGGRRGKDGRKGSDGRRGQAGRSQGGGSKGSITYTCGGESASTRFYPCPTGAVLADANGDGIFEPGDTIKLSDVRVQNKGGLSFPDDIVLRGELSVDGEDGPKGTNSPVPVKAGIGPGQSTTAEMSLTLPTLDAVPFNAPQCSTAQLKIVPSLLGRGFEEGQRQEFCVGITIQYPVRCSLLKGPTLLGPGEAGSFTVEVTNISLGVYAGGVDSLGDVEVQFTILEPDGSFSFRAPPPQGGNDQPEVVVDDAGVTATVAVPPSLQPNESAALTVPVLCTGEAVAHMFETGSFEARLKLRGVDIERHVLPIRIVPCFSFESEYKADILVTSPEIGRDEFLAYSKLFTATGAGFGSNEDVGTSRGVFNVWDIKRYGGFAATQAQCWVDHVGPSNVVVFPSYEVGLSPQGGCSAEMLRQFDVRRLLEEEPTRAILLLNATCGGVDHVLLDAEDVAQLRRSGASNASNASAAAAEAETVSGCAPALCLNEGFVSLFCCAGCCYDRSHVEQTTAARAVAKRFAAAAALKDKEVPSHAHVGARLTAAPSCFALSYEGTGGVLQASLPRTTVRDRIMALSTGALNLSDQSVPESDGAEMYLRTPFARAYLALLALRPFDFVVHLASRPDWAGGKKRFPTVLFDYRPAVCCSAADSVDGEAANVSPTDLLHAVALHRLDVGTALAKIEDRHDAVGDAAAMIASVRGVGKATGAMSDDGPAMDALHMSLNAALHRGGLPGARRHELQDALKTIGGGVDARVHRPTLRQLLGYGDERVASRSGDGSGGARLGYASIGFMGGDDGADLAVTKRVVTSGELDLIASLQRFHTNQGEMLTYEVRRAWEKKCEETLAAMRQGLEPPWQPAIEHGTGKPYYVNHETGESQWNRPDQPIYVVATAVEMASPRVIEVLPIEFDVTAMVMDRSTAKDAYTYTGTVTEVTDQRIDNYIYTGTVNEAGKPEGRGIQKYDNGNIYECDFQNGKKHGEGTATKANGDKYEGAFADSKRHGSGTYTYANGDKYVGNYVEDKMHGSGAYKFANGDEHVGDFEHGKSPRKAPSEQWQQQRTAAATATEDPNVAVVISTEPSEIQLELGS